MDTSRRAASFSIGAALAGYALTLAAAWRAADAMHAALIAGAASIPVLVAIALARRRWPFDTMGGGAGVDVVTRLTAAQALGEMGDWLFDPATGRVELSPQVCRMYGRPEAQGTATVGELTALYPADQQASIAIQLDDVLRTGATRRYDVHRIDADGSLRHEAVVATRESAPDGSPRIRGVVQDVTHRRRAERELAREQERVALAVAAADIGLWHWEVGADEVFYSSTWKRQLGYADDEVGSGFDEWRTRVHPDDLELALQRLDAFLARPEGLFRSEFRMRHRDGSWRSLLATGSLLRGRDGERATMLGAHVDITEMRRATEALAASESRLRRVVDGLGPHMYAALLTPDGRIEWVNSAAVDTSGLAHDALAGVPLPQAPVWEGIPEEQPRLIANVQAAARGEPSRWDLQIATASGARRWVDTSLRPVFKSDGTVDCIIASGVDIDERKRAEAELVQSEARLRRVLDGLGPRIFVGLCDTAGRLTWVNRVSLEIAALTESDVLGLHFADTYWWCFDPGVSGRLRSAMDRALAGDVVRYDENVRILDGLLWVDFCVQPLRDGAGAITGLVVSAFDISERRAAQAQLADRERMLRGVFDSVADPLFLLHASHDGTRVAIANRAYDIAFAADGDAAPAALPGFAAASRRLAAGEPRVAWETTARINGLTRCYEASLSALRTDDGGQQLIGALHDVTALREGIRQRQRLAQRLVELQEAEQRRLSAELHDRIGQALTGLGLNLDLIASSALPDAAREARLHDSRSLLGETIAAVRDLVSELRPPALVDYGVLAALRELAMQIGARSDLRIRVAGDEPHPRLPPALETAMYRIAQEAFANVQKHARATHVDVMLGHNEGFVELAIGDDGRGFDPDAAAIAHGHWGLGLMKERAAAVGGEVRIESRPGGGTCVRVRMAVSA